MDILTLKKAMNYAKSLSEESEGDITELEAMAAIIDQDGDNASKLIINALRQHIQTYEDEAPVCEAGTVSLTNSLKFPFNNSRKSVALAKAQADTNYAVIAVPSEDLGNIGEVTVTDKQTNGFKVGFSGSAEAATIKYIVIGGIVK